MAHPTPVKRSPSSTSFSPKPDHALQRTAGSHPSFWLVFSLALAEPGGVKPSPFIPMKSTWSLLLLLALALLGPAEARALLPFQDESPDHKFLLVCDLAAQPPFRIIDQISGEVVASLDDDGVSQYNMVSSWSPNSKLLVVLATWKRWTQIYIFRLVDGQFVCTKDPMDYGEDLSFGRWIAPNKMRLKVEDHPRTLVIADQTARFAR